MPSAPAAPVAAPSPHDVRGGVRGTYIAFIGCGFAFAGWASRIPQVRDHLNLSPAQLGLVLLAIAAGSLVALPLAGPVVHRLGSRRTVAVMAVVLTAGLATIALGYLGGLVPMVAGLFLLGFASGAWDVAMNVQGALVERHLGRSIMSRFHAGYSLGTVAGALIGAAMVALHVPVTVHLLVVAAVVGLVVPWGARSFVHDAAGVEEHPEETGRRSALAAWREPRTLLIGVFVLAFAFAEGTGNDWVGVAAIDGYGVPAAVGTLAFAVFLSAMTLGRWFGPGLLDRYGRVSVVRALAVLGIAGTLLFVFAPVTPLAFAGAVLWGVGASLGFPVGMSAGADEPRYAAGRVSVIASIGYCAFLAGPPSVGFLADHLTVLRAVVAVAVLLGVAALVSAVVRPPNGGVPAAGTEQPAATGHRTGPQDLPGDPADRPGATRPRA
ncbi:MFS transporter [Peterkaempfera griseoplana]|uniref:MFS transporter n=1 Tax=Peterkaempfera griseoplana TaxID=66896 RepID=UPI0007C7B3C8|nr:MFS transporter [Peterkaempfera griseoplana]